MRVLGLTVQPRRLPLPVSEKREQRPAIVPEVFTNTLLRQPATDVVQFGMAPPRPPESFQHPTPDELAPLLPQVTQIAADMATKAGVRPDSLKLSDRTIVNGTIYFDEAAHDTTIDASSTASLLSGKTVDSDQDKAFALVDVRKASPTAPWTLSGVNAPFGTLVQDIANEMNAHPTAGITLLRGLPGTATSGLTALRFKEADQPPAIKILTTANSVWPGTYPPDNYALNVGDMLSEAVLGQKVTTLGRMHQEKTLAVFLTGAAGSVDERAKVGRLLPQIVGDAKSVELLPKVDALATTTDSNARYEAIVELVKASLTQQRIRLRPYYDSFRPS